MDVFKTYLFFSGYDEGHSYLIDTIFYEGEWWLVPNWLGKGNERKIPVRLIRLTGLKYQEVNDEGYRFLLNNAIPKSVMDGQPQEGYVIRDYPAVEESKGPSSVH